MTFQLQTDKKPLPIPHNFSRDEPASTQQLCANQGMHPGDPLRVSRPSRGWSRIAPCDSNDRRGACAEFRAGHISRQKSGRLACGRSRPGPGRIHTPLAGGTVSRRHRCNRHISRASVTGFRNWKYNERHRRSKSNLFRQTIAAATTEGTQAAKRLSRIWWRGVLRTLLEDRTISNNNRDSHICPTNRTCKLIDNKFSVAAWFFAWFQTAAA